MKRRIWKSKERSSDRYQFPDPASSHLIFNFQEKANLAHSKTVDLVEVARQNLNVALDAAVISIYSIIDFWWSYREMPNLARKWLPSKSSLKPLKVTNAPLN
jgi:hypothetical protein